MMLVSRFVVLMFCCVDCVIMLLRWCVVVLLCCCVVELLCCCFVVLMFCGLRCCVALLCCCAGFCLVVLLRVGV